MREAGIVGHRINAVVQSRMIAEVPGPELSILIQPWQAVYVEVPKVACSSIKLAIAELLDSPLDGPGGDPHQSTFPVVTPDTDGPVMFPGFFSFTFVRNPWSRLLSCYRDKICLQVNGYTHSTIRPGMADFVTVA